MADPTAQDRVRAREYAEGVGLVEQTVEGDPLLRLYRSRLEGVIATALAEQRERYERLLDAAAMVEPLRHFVSTEHREYTPGAKTPSERLADLAEAVAAILEQA